MTETRAILKKMSSNNRSFLLTTHAAPLSTSAEPRRRIAWNVAFILVMLAAGWLRFGLGRAGLPFLYDMDEPVFVDIAYRMLVNRDPNPHWFGHPGTVTIYLLSVLYGIYGVVGVALGWFASLKDIGQEFWSEPANFYLLGRWSSAFFGVGSVALLCALARELAGRGVGLLAALLLALAPQHIEYSAVIRTDIQQSFFLLGVGWFSLRMAQGGSRRDAIWAGALLGLAIATKYPSVLGAVMLVAGGLAGARQQCLPWHTAASPLVWAALATVLACFAATPFLFLDFSQVLADVFQEARPVHLSATSKGFASAAWYYMSSQVGGMLGPAGIVLALLGSAWLVYARPAAAAVLIGFFACYLVFISAMHLVWARWAIPLLPLACLAAALGAGLVWELVQRLWPGRLGVALVLAGLTALLGINAVHAYQIRAELLAPAPATLARDWSMQHLPKGARILVERYTPQFDNGYFALFEVTPEGHVARAGGGVAKYVIPNGVIGDLRSIDLLQTYKIDYIVLGNDFDRRAVESRRYASAIARYEYILAHWPLMYETRATSLLSRGGVVRVLRAPQY